MTLYEVLSSIIEDEEIWAVTLRRECWPNYLGVYIDLFNSPDLQRMFKVVFVEDNEEHSLWSPVTEDILATDWVIKDTEKF